MSKISFAGVISYIYILVGEKLKELNGHYCVWVILKLNVLEQDT